MSATPVAPSLSYLAAQPEHLGAAVALMAELVAELDPSPSGDRITALLPADISWALASDTSQIFLAWDRGVPVGLSRGDILNDDPIFRLREDKRCGYVDQMYVQPQYRDQQVGQQLLQCCEDWFRAQGLKYTLLHAAPRAVRFYARCGYQPNREMFKEL
jgi:GNAT superfamily N-acetyltransferase